MKKIISIILIISLLAAILTITVSAYNSSGKVTYTSPVRMSEQRESALVTHTNYSMNTANISGAFTQLLWSVPMQSEDAKVTYSYDFTVTTTGFYYFLYSFASSNEVYHFSVNLKDNDTFGGLRDWNRPYWQLTSKSESFLMPNEMIAGHNYTMNITIGVDNVNFWTPIKYDINMGMMYSSTGNSADVDIPVDTNQMNNGYLTFDHTDAQGRIWYLYHGYKPIQAGSSGGSSPTTVWVNNCTDYSWTFDLDITAGGTASYLYYYARYFNMMNVNVPKTGMWEFGYSMDSYQANLWNDENTPMAFYMGFNSNGTSAVVNFPGDPVTPLTGIWTAAQAPISRTEGTTFGPLNYLGQNTNGTQITLRFTKSTDLTINDLRFYMVCTPSTPYAVKFRNSEGLDPNYEFTYNDVDYNYDAVEQNGDVQFPDPEGVWGVHDCTTYSYESDGQVLNFETVDGYTGHILYTEEGIYIEYVYNGQTYTYTFLYNNPKEIETVPEIKYDNSGGGSSGSGDSPKADPFNLWNWLMELLASILETVFGLIKALVEGIFNIFADFIGGALQKLTDFFGVFGNESGALDFFNEGTGFEWSTP